MYYLKDKKKTVRKPANLKDKLDRIFSEYIRLRDSKPYGYKAFRCIACGQVKPYDQADCGHYFSRTHLATRYDEMNCWAECRYCNRFRADHMDDYRRNLINKIGQQKYDLLSVKAHSIVHISEFEYKQMIKYYKALVDNLKSM